MHRVSAIAYANERKQSFWWPIIFLLLINIFVEWTKNFRKKNDLHIEYEMRRHKIIWEGKWKIENVRKRTEKRKLPFMSQLSKNLVERSKNLWGAKFTILGREEKLRDRGLHHNGRNGTRIWCWGETSKRAFQKKIRAMHQLFRSAKGS